MRKIKKRKFELKNNNKKQHFFYLDKTKGFHFSVDSELHNDVLIINNFSVFFIVI